MASDLSRTTTARLAILWFFGRQQKQCSQGPYSKEQAGHRPRQFLPAAVSRDDPAKNGIENMHERRRAKQGHRVHFGFYEQESGEVAEQMIPIHCEALTLAFHS